MIQWRGRTKEIEKEDSCRGYVLEKVKRDAIL